MTAKEAYPIAKARAGQWCAEPFLQQVVSNVKGQEVELGPREITFYFACDRVQGRRRWRDTIVVGVDTEQGTVTTNTGGSSIDHGPCDLESAVLDSSDALQRAEELGGRAYREKYPEAVVSISAEQHSIPGYVEWGVDYIVPGEPGLGFGIDSKTGAIIGSHGR